MDKKKDAEKEEKKVQDTAEEQTEERDEKTAEQSDIDKLKEELAKQKDKYIRLLAEYDNYQKRTQREKAARYADAVVDTVEKILPIGDNIERALKTEVTSEDAVKFKEGVEMVMKQFFAILEKLDVTPIKAEGEQFDPNLHNALCI